MTNRIRKYPVLSYYLLVFIISWGGMLILIGGPAHIPGTIEQVEQLFFPALVIMFAGPFLSGIVMNLIMYGKAGIVKLVSEFLHFPSKLKWYGIAILTAPVLVLMVLFGLTIFNAAFLPGLWQTEDKLQSLIFGVSWGLVGGGLFEETGWTGFAVPHLRKHYSIFITGMIVGILWGVWHFMIAFWSINLLGGNDSMMMFMFGFIAFYFLALPAYRVILVWFYERTQSLSLVMVMHAALSASTLILQPPASGVISFTWNLVLGIVLWLIVAALLFRSKTSLPV